MNTSEEMSTRASLETRLRTIRLRLEEIQKILREPEDGDIEEQATEVDDDMVLERLAGASRDEMRQILVALQRIDKGDYGHCETCGKRIAAKRLRALPETSLCRVCAEKTV